MEELFDFTIDPEEMLGGKGQEKDPDKVEEVIEHTEGTEGTEDVQEIEEDTEEVMEDDVPADAVKVFYDFVVENGIIEEIENFDNSIDTIKQELENLPVKSFQKAVSSLPELGQQVVNYVFSKDNVTVDDFKSFIENQVEPAYQEITVDDTESARAFLEKQYKDMGIYSDDDDLLEALDLLEEKGTLLKTAKQLANKVNSELKAQLDAEIQQAVKAKEEAKKLEQEQNKQLVQGINTTLEELKWHDNRKRAVIENLKPDVLQRKNEAIRKSYKAIVQLADLYSYFDEKKGEFDFSKLVDVKASSKQASDTKKRMQEDKFSSAIAGLGKQLPNRKEKSILEVVDFDYDEE